jgi:Uma2 family endonuclease
MGRIRQFENVSVKRIDDYICQDEGEFPTELVRGESMPRPFAKLGHGLICANVIRALAKYEERTNIGRATAYSGIVTHRDPDTLRGADACFYSFDRLPRDADLDQYPPLPPELVVEVKSPTDSWPDLTEKVAEHLHAGVDVVCVIDPDERVAVVPTASGAPRTVTSEQSLELPVILPGFQLPLNDLFF